MAAQEGNIADITGPKTHIDDLIALHPVPDALDMAEANKINRAHAAAIRNVVAAALYEGYKLEAFKLNRDIRTPVKVYMGQLKSTEIYHPWAFVRQVKLFILAEGNDRATLQLLGIRPEDSRNIPQPIIGGRVDTASLLASPQKASAVRKRPPTAGRGANKQDAEEQRMIKRIRSNIIQSSRQAGGASDGMDDDDETGDNFIDQYDNHRPTTAHGFSADASPASMSPGAPAGGWSPGSTVEDTLNKLVRLSELQVLSRGGGGGGGGGGDGGQFVKPADFPKGLLEKLDIHDTNTKRVLDDLEEFLSLRSNVGDRGRVQCLLWTV